MNVAVQATPSPAVSSAAHGVFGYDRKTDALVQEIAIPDELDCAALKIAKVAADDPEGALSYPLGPKQVEALRVLLGFDVNLDCIEYFLEASPASAVVLPHSV
jgi:hypothetical protein